MTNKRSGCTAAGWLEQKIGESVERNRSAMDHISKNDGPDGRAEVAMKQGTDIARIIAEDVVFAVGVSIAMGEVDAELTPRRIHYKVVARAKSIKDRQVRPQFPSNMQKGRRSNATQLFSVCGIRSSIRPTPT